MLNRLINVLIQRTIKINRQKVKNSFNRVLPVGDYFSDRWEKANFYGFGDGTSVYDNALIFGDVKVGMNCWIGPNCILDGSGGELFIGDNCSIAAGAHIYTHDTVKRALSGRVDQIEKSSVFIGDNCYIGPNSIISKGSNISEGCVVGALTFINGMNVPSHSKVYGIPAKIIK